MDEAMKNSFVPSFKGVVVHGNQLGRTIGFPTANIKSDNEDSLESGVFACRVLIHAPEGDFFKYGMLNVGTRPTVSKEPVRSVEVNIFGFSADIYGCEVEVQVLDKVRSELKFLSLEALKNQLCRDRESVLLRYNMPLLPDKEFQED